MQIYSLTKCKGALKYMQEKNRNKEAVKYIGNFPPPYGGVTKKNELLYEVLKSYMTVKCPEKIFLPVIPNNLNAVLSALFSRKRLIVGVSAAKGSSKILTFLLYMFNRRIMKKSVYFMMGGREADRIIGDSKERRWYGSYKRIYVETVSMRDKMRLAGMKNVELYPNCRKRPEKIRAAACSHEKLKCIFFSGISKMKGADIILEAAENIENAEFSFYGHIEQSYKTEFMQRLKKLKNVSYNGVFAGNSSRLYRLLSSYDVLLFPTKWTTEGVPGVLVEAKFAGIVPIVSNICYNSEIITNEADGIVLEENNSFCLENAINVLNNNRNYLKKLKENSLKSAEIYYIEHYLGQILRDLNAEN